MGVDLRCSERSVAEQFLNGSQVRATLEKMGRRGVSQPVRAQVSGPRYGGDPVMDHLARRSRVEPGATCAEQQRRTTRGRHEPGAPAR
jgi:hypothetical protein